MAIGNKIRQLRLRKGLTLEELADRCELSKGFLSQVERDLNSPSIATLTDILECLGTDLQAFFNEQAPEKVIFQKDDIFEKQEDSHAIKWLIPNAQKNRMEPILVTLAPGGCTPLKTPHEGEEFGYVLQGGILLHLGDRAFRAVAGESFYFRPTFSHYIENTRKRTSQLLWIASPPSF